MFFWFKQFDVRGNALGILTSHSTRPLLSLHHMPHIDPIFPNSTTFSAVRHLFSAVELDPLRIFQLSVCYDRWYSWTISVSWGYTVQVNISLPFLNLILVWDLCIIQFKCLVLIKIRDCLIVRLIVGICFYGMLCGHKRRSDHGTNPADWQVFTHLTQERSILILAKDLSLSTCNMFLLVPIMQPLKVFISKLTRIAPTIPLHRLAKSKRLECIQKDSIPISDR